MSDEKGKVKWLRSPVGVIGAIFLGAVGSGFWEVFLKDALISAYVAFSSLLGSFFYGYLDDLHEDIGKANNNEVGITLFLFLIVAILFLNILGARFIVHIYKRLTNEHTKEQKNPPSLIKLKAMVVTVILMSAFNVVAYSHEAFATLYRLRAITWTEQSIEIVHPSISEHEYLMLRAQYRSVNSAKEFYALVKKIHVYASRTNTNLPKFSAIGEQET